MSHVFQIPDSVFATFSEFAQGQGKTPEEILLEWMSYPWSIMISPTALPALAATHPEEAFQRLAGIFRVPVEPGWADVDLGEDEDGNSE